MVVAYAAAPQPAANSPRRPVESLHCLDADYQVGPVPQPSAIFRLASDPSRSPVEALPALSLMAVGKIHGLWSRAPREGPFPFSFLSGLSPHLFLSVLRI